MEAQNQDVDVINVGIHLLHKIELLPNKVYNIDTKILRVISSYQSIFAKICKLLTSTTSVLALKIDFWLDAPALQLLGEAMAQNQSIKSICLSIDHLVPTDHFKSFISSIQTRISLLKSVKFKIDPEDNDLGVKILDSIKGVYMPAKTFSVRIIEFLFFDEFNRTNVEVLKTTNINKLNWHQVSLFGTPSIETEGIKGFREFCEHVIQQNTLKSFKASIITDNNTLPYIAKMISKCKALHEISLEIDRPPEQFDHLLDALVKSNLRRLTVAGLQNDPENWNKMANAFKSMEKLTYLSFTGCGNEMDPKQFLSESVRDCKIHVQAYLMRAVSEALLQNKKLQNERVRAIITLLFNIARDTSLMIPRDIWIVIMSFVAIPGVSLDFGTIAHLIFKDTTIRRVIYKSIRRSRVVTNK